MNRGMITGIVGVIAFVVIAAGVLLFLRDDDEPVEAGIEGLQSFSDEPNDHVEENVDYDQAPPIGGTHFPAWMDCGVYDVQVPDELAVHNMEHGGIWIAYDPAALDDAQVTTLADAVPDNGIMTPYEGLESPVVVSSWERQVAIEEVDDARIAEFIDAYENSPIAPESGLVSCTGGVTADEAAQIAEQYSL